MLQGIVGNLASGKSALVHRYLTGTYVQEESPEGMLFWQTVSIQDCPAHPQSAGVEHPRPGPASSEGLLSKVLPPLTQRRPWRREEGA